MLISLVVSRASTVTVFAVMFSQKWPSRHTFIEPRSCISYTLRTAVPFTVGMMIATRVESLGIAWLSAVSMEKVPTGVVIEAPAVMVIWPNVSIANVTGTKGSL
jgi:hypothetical protein